MITSTPSGHDAPPGDDRSGLPPEPTPGVPPFDGPAPRTQPEHVAPSHVEVAGLEAALNRLMAAHVIDDHQAAAVLAEFAGADHPAALAAAIATAERPLPLPTVADRNARSGPHPAATGRTRRGAVLAEIAAYAGAVLVAVAGVVGVAQSWDDMGTPLRVGVLVATALTLGVAGVLVLRGGGGFAEARTSPDAAVRRRLASALLVGGVLAAALVPFGLRGDELDSPLSIGLIGLALGVPVYVTAPSVVAHVGLAVATLVTGVGLYDLANVPERYDLWLPSLLAVIGGVAWAAASQLGVFRERTLGTLGGGALAVMFAQSIRFGAERYEVINGEDNYTPPSAWPAVAITAALAALAFTAYTLRSARVPGARQQDWPLLVVGVLAVAFAAGRVVAEFAGGAGGLLVVGALGLVLLVGAGVSVGLAARRHKPDSGPTAGAPPGASSPQGASADGGPINA